MAAHISAAAVGGPRYDVSLSPQQRSDGANGIWLCQNCAKLIDSDTERFPASRLREWKTKAVDGAFAAVAAAPKPYNEIAPACDDAEPSSDLTPGLGPNEDVSTTGMKMRTAVAAYLEAFRSAREWPQCTAELGFNTIVDGAAKTISLEGIAAGSTIAEGVSIVAAPGTGKSTTLVQLADRMVEMGGAVPLLVPLGEWSDRHSDFFDFIAQRDAFRSFRRGHFTRLAFHGRLVLLLDGWNELTLEARTRATRDLRALRREFPMLGVVTATRKQFLPVKGSIVSIAPLSEDQQVALARKIRGESGEALVDQAWRTPGVRELISVPLYLQALLASLPGAVFPTTKDEILGLFVRQHEDATEKADALRAIFHTQMLVGLAAAATRLSTSTLADENARRVIRAVGASLVASGQLASAPQPDEVLDKLVALHVLVRAAQGSEISFQHQQFQEWFASFEVECLLDAAWGEDRADASSQKPSWLYASSSGHETEAKRGSGRQALRTLREDVLDRLAWEEPILFAAERVSRRDTSGANAVGRAIIETLGIDPMLSAALIFRAAEQTWMAVQREVTTFIETWHKPGEPDRAIRFMIITGRPEFARYVWPLVSNPDSQIHLRVLRKAERFQPGVLGPEPSIRLRTLPVECRKNVMSEIATRSGFEGMQLAADFVKSEAEPDVVVEVLHALDFRRAERHVNQVLKTASDEVWRRLADFDFPESLSDPDLNARLMAERESVSGDGSAKGPLESLHRLVRRGAPFNAAAAKRVETLIASEEFPLREPQCLQTLHAAATSFGTAVANALVTRLSNGLELPAQADGFLTEITPIDQGPVATLALDPATPARAAGAAFRLLGPRTIGELIDRCLTAQGAITRSRSPISEAERNNVYRLKDAIRVTRTDCFFTALVERSETEQPDHIGVLCDLIARHGSDSSSEEPNIGSNRPKIVNALLGWSKLLLGRPEASRHQLAEVAQAMARVPDPRFAPLLDDMLQRDLSEWTHAREVHRLHGRGGHMSADVVVSHTLLYRRAFSAVGGIEVFDCMTRWLPDLQFGFDAAYVLFDMWQKVNRPVEAKRGGRDYSDVKAKRAQRNLEGPSPTSDAAEAIFGAAHAMGGRGEADVDKRRHALRLATIGVLMPHGDKASRITTFLAFPEPWVFKRDLLSGMAIAGEILPAESLVAGTMELLALGERDAWRLADDRGELAHWLELFAFSDRPAAVLEVIDHLPEACRLPWSFGTLLSALGDSPNGAEAVDILQALAERHPTLTEAYEWWNALIKIGTERSSLALLDLVVQPSERGRAVDRWRIAEVLADAAQAHPAVRASLFRRYEDATTDLGGDALALVLTRIADAECALLMIRCYAASGRSFDHALSGILSELAVGRRSFPDWPGAFEEFSVPLVELRRTLFGMFIAGGSEAVLAEACLARIDQLRDRHGLVEDEPRHPAIATGHAWPAAAGKSLPKSPAPIAAS